MRIDIIRRRFPEYGDMPDDSLVEAFKGLIEQITEPMEDEGPKEVVAIGVAEAIADLKSSVEKLTNTVKARPTAKDAPDITAHLVALGVQMGKVCDAVNSLKLEVPEKEEKAELVVKSFKIKRGEMGGITEVVPVYEAE